MSGSILNLVGSISQYFQNLFKSISNNITIATIFNIQQLSSLIDRGIRYYATPNISTALNAFNIQNSPSWSALPHTGESHIGRSQVNRLITGDETELTYVALRNAHRETYIPMTYMSSNSYWHEPESNYNSLYPHNNATATRNGIVQEMDDTPGSIRYAVWHPSGSYQEITHYGSNNNKIVGDKFEIIAGNNSVYIKGQCAVVIDGECDVLINNKVNLQVNGPLNALVNNDLNVVVAGNTLFNTNGATLIKSSNIQFEANTINVIASNVDIQSNTLSIKTTTFQTDAANTFIINSPKVVQNSHDVYFNNSFIHALMGQIVVDTDGGQSIYDFLQVLDQNNYNVVGLQDIKTSNIAPPITPSITAVPVEPNYKPPINAAVIAAVSYDDRPQGTTIPVNFLTAPAYANAQLQNTTVNIASANSVVFNSQANASTNNFIGQTNIPGITVLSKHCTLAQVSTDTAVSHYKVQAQRGLTEGEIVGNLQYLALNVIDNVIDTYGKGNVVLTSGFRFDTQYYQSPHALGQAIDIQFKDIPKSQYAIRAAEIAKSFQYDQVIFEYAWHGTEYTAWVHIGTKSSGNRQQVATMNASTGQFIPGQIINIFDNNTTITTTNANAKTDGIITSNVTPTTTVST